MSNNFKLSNRSLQNLLGVHDDLVDIVNLALDITTVDFGITCGLRTLEEQRALCAAGKSQTMHSKHLNGLAVDFLPYYMGKAQPENWPLHFQVADAFREAALYNQKVIVWGGAWFNPVGNVTAPNNVLEAQRNYISIKSGRKEPLFLDGPHIELYGDYGVAEEAAE